MSSKSKKQFILPKLSEKLKQARKQKGLTQGQLAQKIGADIQRISKYERGILIPTTEVMIKFSFLIIVRLCFSGILNKQIQDQDQLLLPIQLYQKRLLPV